MAADLAASSGVSFLRVFRLGRTLRPLRVIRGNPSMRIVVSSLINSFSDVVTVFVLTQCVLVMFAILGVSLYSGQLYSCNNPDATGRADCVGTFFDAAANATVDAVWANPSYSGDSQSAMFSFDDFYESYLTVTDVVGIEGFTDVLYAVMAVTGQDKQPRGNASPANALFIVAVIFTCTFFLLNVYAGVIVQSYARSDGTAFMTVQQREWVNTKMMVSGGGNGGVRSVPACALQGMGWQVRGGVVVCWEYCTQ